MITVVAGFPRSGTSLTMRMLWVGGLEPYADNLESFETRDIFRLPTDHGWLDQAEGKTIKLLEPSVHRLPKKRSYRFIWLNRNLDEQCKSQAKLLSVGGHELNRAKLRSLRQSLERDRPKAIKLLQSYPSSKLLQVKFEKLLADPQAEAQRIADFCGGLDAARMASLVVPRSPACYPGILEARIYQT